MKIPSEAEPGDPEAETTELGVPKASSLLIGRSETHAVRSGEAEM